MPIILCVPLFRNTSILLTASLFPLQLHSPRSNKLRGIDEHSVIFVSNWTSFASHTNFNECIHLDALNVLLFTSSVSSKRKSIKNPKHVSLSTKLMIPPFYSTMSTVSRLCSCLPSLLDRLGFFGTTQLLLDSNNSLLSMHFCDLHFLNLVAEGKSIASILYFLPLRPKYTVSLYPTLSWSRR